MLRKIRGVIKHYDWGGFDFLPELLDLEKTGEPFGEYWLGTHPDGMSRLIESNKSLAEANGGDLSYLLKILDVRNMLSIQVHPDKTTAEAGFAREEEMGKDRNAYDRVYRDKNHKPELMVALSDFWLVQGFKTDQEIIRDLEANPELEPITEYYQRTGLEKTYTHLMTMPQEEVNAILKPLGQRIKPLYEKNALKKEDINFWAARAFLTYNRKGVCDRGIFSLYLMNLVHLKPGEGIYQAPGVLHAYMEGQNIECMATSDNVIRGGLTAKHIDIDQLLKIVEFKSVPPQIIKPEEGEYETPASEFQLVRISSIDSKRITPGSILLNIGSEIEINFNSSVVILSKGEAAVTTSASSIGFSENPQALYLATGE
ncbi:MAG: mannose-6-phosphate isomerase, class I [Saprospiraceae bacterium]|nr:mannose-6-phosphate isomerase, class I [Saprospiraceae bacterium]